MVQVLPAMLYVENSMVSEAYEENFKPSLKLTIYQTPVRLDPLKMDAARASNVPSTSVAFSKPALTAFMNSNVSKRGVASSSW